MVIGRVMLSFTPPTRAAVRIGLDDAFDAVNQNLEGTPRFPLTWTAKSAQFGVQIHQPVVGVDGTIYQVDNRRIQALDPLTGEERFSIAGKDLSPPTKLGDQLICSDSDSVFAYDPVKRERTWEVPVSGWGKRPAVSPEGVVFAGDAGSVLALEGATGQELWRQPTPAAAFMLGYSPAHKVAVAYNGVYASDKECLFAYDKSGEALWSKNYSGKAAMSQKGPLFLVKERTFKLWGSSHSLQAVNPRTGAKLWSHSADDSTSLWATPEGNLLVRDGRELRLRNGQTGDVSWIYQLNGDVHWNGPHAGITFAQGALIVTHPDGQLTNLDPATGEVRWDEKSRGPSTSGPAVGPEGILILKTEGTLKGLIPQSVARPARARPGVEETDGAIQIGSVRLAKRKTD